MLKLRRDNLTIWVDCNRAATPIQAVETQTILNKKLLDPKRCSQTTKTKIEMEVLMELVNTMEGMYTKVLTNQEMRITTIIVRKTVIFLLVRITTHI